MALAEKALWALTPREFAALRKVQEQVTDETRAMYASIQATLHNAWLRGKGRRPYKPDDFLPGKRKQQTWREKQSILKMLLTANDKLPKLELPPQAVQ